MIKLVLYGGFLLAILGIAALVHLLVYGSVYEKTERYLHCRYILAVFLLALLVCNRYTYAYVLLHFDKLINLPAAVQFTETVLPLRNFELVYLLLIFCLSNLSFLLLFGLLLFLVKMIFRRKEYLNVFNMEMGGRILHLPWNLCGLFYKEDEEREEFRVSERGFTVGLWAKRMKFVFFLFVVLELIVMSVGIFTEQEELTELIAGMSQGWYLFPVMGYLLLEQMQFFLEADVEIDAGSFGTEKIGDKLEGNMDVLAWLYTQQFGQSNAILGNFSWKEMEVRKDGLTNNGLNQNQMEECKQPEVLAILNNHLKDLGIAQNASYQNMLAALLNGESVNVRDYIQGEILYYLAVYVNFKLSQENTFLVLCEKEEDASKIRQAFTDVLNELNKIYSIWDVSNLDDADSNEVMSVLVCSFSAFNTHMLVKKRRDFFENLSDIIIAGGENFCAQGNVYKEAIFADIRKISRRVQYIILSEKDNDSLRTAFEYYTGQELILYKNDQMLDNFYVMIWKEEGSYKLQRYLNIGNDQSPYMGTAIPLSLVALKYDMPSVSVFAGDETGHYSYRDVMKMSFQEVAQYLHLNLDLDKMIQYNHFGINKREGMKTLILHDSDYNFYNLIWAWMKYGGKDSTMIHIVSPPYMLREYFAANLQTKMIGNNDFDAIISYQSFLKNNCFLTILLYMCTSGITEEEIMEQNQEYKWNYTDVTQVLSDSLKSVLNEQEFYNIYECFQFEERRSFDVEKDSFVHQTVVKLSDENIRRRVYEKLARVKMFSKNGNETELTVLRENVYNYYLPEQIVPIENYMYRVISINGGNIFAEQILPLARREYYPVSEFELTEMCRVDECVDMDILDFNMYTADVTRYIYGYWQSNVGLDFVNAGKMKMCGICDGYRNPVIDCKRDVAVLEIRLKRKALSGDAKKTVFLAAFMLQELFKTLFPKTYMNLFVITEFCPEQEYWEKLLRDNSEVSFEDRVRSIVPFCRPTESEKDGEYLKIYVVEFSSLDMGMITSLYANRMRVFQMMERYLAWYIYGNKTEVIPDGEEKEGKEKDGEEKDAETDVSKPAGTYLNLGGTGIASAFDAKSLFAYTCLLLPQYESFEKTKSAEIAVKPEYRCSFCGKPSIFTYVMDDGRQMCRSCKQQQIGQRDEIKELYRDTIEFLQKTYHIRIRKNIHIRFQSAETIRKVCQISGGGRVLGFYQNKKHELWIEARGPKNAVWDTMIHELTHAWQFDNLNLKKLYKKPKEEQLLYLEGHAAFMEVDAMRRLGELEYAEYLEEIFMQRQDEYGEGFRMQKDYLEQAENKGSYYTPFEAMKDLVEML